MIRAGRKALYQQDRTGRGPPEGHPIMCNGESCTSFRLPKALSSPHHAGPYGATHIGCLKIVAVRLPHAQRASARGGPGRAVAGRPRHRENIHAVIEGLHEYLELSRPRPDRI